MVLPEEGRVFMSIQRAHPESTLQVRSDDRAGTLTELLNHSENLFHWFLQERDKLLRFRKQRKKMAKLPKVKETALTCAHTKRVFLKAT